MAGRERAHAWAVDLACLDPQRAAAGHGIAGVDGEVEQGEFKLVGVDAGGRKIWREGNVDVDRRPERAREHVAHPFEQGGNGDRSRLEILATGEGEQALDESRGAARRLQAAVDQPLGAGIIGEAAAEQVEIADHRGEKIVEIMRHPAGQLAERLELLRLVELGHGTLMLAGAFVDAGFEGFIDLAKALLAVLERDQPGAGLILATAGAQRRSGDADEGGRVERPFEEGHVAEQFEQSPGGRIALQPAALGEDDERQVGPFGLGVDPVGQAVEIDPHQRFFGDQRKARPGFEPVDQPVGVAEGGAGDLRFVQHRQRDTGVAASRREHQRAFGEAVPQAPVPWAGDAINSGTPRRTPWKPVSGSPSSPATPLPALRSNWFIHPS